MMYFREAEEGMRAFFGDAPRGLEETAATRPIAKLRDSKNLMMQGKE